MKKKETNGNNKAKDCSFGRRVTEVRESSAGLRLSEVLMGARDRVRNRCGIISQTFHVALRLFLFFISKRSTFDMEERGRRSGRRRRRDETRSQRDGRDQKRLRFLFFDT